MTPETLARSGSEFGEQSALFAWCYLATTRARFPHFYNAATKRCKMFAVYNNAGVDGDQRTAAIRGQRAKQTGTQSGVFDLIIPLARHGVHGLFVEMKIDPAHPENQRTGTKGKAIKAKTGTVSPDQIEFGRQVQEDGYGAVVCEGWKAAVAVIEAYLS